MSASSGAPAGPLAGALAGGPLAAALEKRAGAAQATSPVTRAVAFASDPESPVTASPTGAQLRNQVRHALPFLFEPSFRNTAMALGYDFLTPVWMPSLGESIIENPVEYFQLCLAAHWATTGAHALSDVDSQIRHRLWAPGLTHAELDQMAERVIEAYRWPTALLSQRSVRSSVSGEFITAHQGEWLSVAGAAYAATRRRNPARAAELLERIQFEITRQAKVYLEFKRTRDGVGLLKAATLIAHNLSDLDRVIEMWGLASPPTLPVAAGIGAESLDPLVEFAYRTSHESGSRALRFSGSLAEAGRLHRAFMASENHRHFKLLIPRVLRRSPDFLLPVAPFFDEWGETLALHPEVRTPDVIEVIETLILAWEKLKGPEGKVITYAYPRAIAGFVERYPGGMDALIQMLPARTVRTLRSGLLHSLASVSRAKFEEQWSQMALHFVK